jgi:hypothetical protein
MKLIIIIIVILNVFYISTCNAQSKLPKEMPADVKMTYDSTGNMGVGYTEIEVSGDTLTFSETKTSNRKNMSGWSAKISAEDKESVYEEFFNRKVDTIKNEPTKGTVFDAGVETITISFSGLMFRVQSGKNSPLSKQNGSHFQAIATDFKTLSEKYESTSESRFAIISNIQLQEKPVNKIKRKNL